MTTNSMRKREPDAPHAVEGEHSTAGSLLGFFALTFLVTWTCFVAAVALSNDLPPGAGLRPGVRALILLGTFAPALVALTLTARARGTAGVRALLGHLIEWRVGSRWYVFAVGYMAAIRLTAALGHRVATGVWPLFSFDGWYLMVAATALSTVVGGQAGEEIGWRGYALPRLAARLGLGGASVVLGAIWAIWHLPLFYLRGADTYGQSFPAYLLQVTAVSVAMAWLYWRTRGSLLLVMLMHAAVNNLRLVPSVPRTEASPFLPSASLMSWLVAVALWMAAGFFLVRMRGAKLPAHLAGEVPRRATDAPPAGGYASSRRP
jgi:membrane protease YdiL (CAAX protease family)